MNIIGRKYIFLSVSGILVALSIGAVLLFWFQFGIDFSGGTLWQVQFAKGGVTKAALEQLWTEKLGRTDVVVIQQENRGFLMRSRELAEPEHQRAAVELRTAFGNFDELRFETIGAAIGVELRSKAITAFLLVLLAISLYIAFAFRKVSLPVSSWKYGVITLLTLFHDALIPVGLFALLGKFVHAEVDVNFIVAIMVVMGFSVHDTIVVFDRIRENLRTTRGALPFSELVNTSVNQTMARSINTSLTLVLVLIALLSFGSVSLQYFVLTILVGTVVGTYSSIFVASPLLTLWQKRG